MVATEVSPSEIKSALRTARRVQPDITKTDLAERLVKANRSRGRGRPPAEIAGLVNPARTLVGDAGMSVGQIVRALA